MGDDDACAGGVSFTRASPQTVCYDRRHADGACFGANPRGNPHSQAHRWMKILLLTEFYPETSDGEITGGIEAVCFYLVKHLRANHEITVLARRTGGDVWEWGSLRSLPGRLAFVISTFATGLKVDFDVVDGTNHVVHPIAWIIGRLRGRAVVYLYADFFGSASTEYFGKAGWILTLVERATLLLPADRVVAVSETVRRKLIGGGVNERAISIVYCGYDEELTAAVIAEELPKEVTLTVVSRLVRYKGVHVAIDALVQLVNEGRDTTLQIVGRGPELDALKEQAHQAGVEDRVSFLGFVPRHIDVLRAISRSRLLVSPSTREGFGIVLAEAMALGVPYVASDIDTYEEITSGGVGGRLFSTENADDLANRIRQLLDNPDEYSETATSARVWAKRYTWSEAAARTEAVLVGAIAARSKSRAPIIFAALIGLFGALAVRRLRPQA
jgi:glycosyltransferase involved in cell wall biosynthesis